MTHPDRLGLPAAWQQALTDYVAKRQKASGGFSATPRLPPTIQDTYHALRILTCLAGPGLDSSGQGDGPLLAYLSQPSPAEHHDAKVTFQRLASCRLLGIEVPAAPVLDFVRRRLTETVDLEERYYCRRLVREIVGRDEAEFNWLADRPSPWSFRTAAELWMLLTLARGTPPDAGALAAWVRDCQTGDGGFGFLPGTTSFIENCYDCLRALRLLASSPHDRQGCQAYVLSCRTKYGGFARKHGATAFLSTSWQALATLELLARP